MAVRYKRKPWEKFCTFLNYLLIIILCISILYPFWYILILSFNTGKDALKGGIYFWPREFTLFNYQMVLSTPTVKSAYLVTIARTILGTALGVIVTACAAYAMACPTLPGKKIFSYVILIPFVFSGGLIPYYLTLFRLGLINTFWVFVLPGLFNIWNMFVMRQFFTEIPESLKEAAIIDGANEYVTLMRIVLPISLPMLAAISLFVAVGHWNSWFDGAFYVSKESLLPLQTYLRRLLDSMSSSMQQNNASDFLNPSILNMEMDMLTSNSLRMASLIVVVLPIMCVYPFLQKYFVKGVRIGAVKG